MQALHDSPRLLGDIGSTYVRFAIEFGPGQLGHIASLRCADFVDFHAAVSSYLASISDLPGGVQQIAHMAIAIANVVEGDQVRMTNYHWHSGLRRDRSPEHDQIHISNCHWQFSIEEMRERLRLDTLVVANDFTALAMSLPRLEDKDKRQIGSGAARVPSVVGVIGAGSGLGVSGLIPAGDGWVALGAEGGHMSFAPRDEREIAILRHGLERFTHVSFERLLSGPGIELIHAALCERDGIAATALSAPEISRRALAGEGARCVETMEIFCSVLGTAAANLAVTLGAFGGIYIGGRIAPLLGEFLDRSPFRARFEDRGRFHDYMASIPTYVITNEHATFIGVSTILDSQLRTLQPDPSASILGQIRRVREQLSPAELRVADHVLARPRDVLSEPIAEIAKAAQVSPPTVLRFCRSLGCEGMPDFKLRLASGLTGTVPVTHTQVRLEDSTIELGAKVLGNTASAILDLRTALNREATERAIDMLIKATRIEFFAQGHYSVVANDAEYKFLRFGISCVARTDPRQQLFAARVFRPGDVAVLISSSGHVNELLEVADTVRALGAQVIAITASQSPLARKADAALIIDHAEDVTTHLPMVSRILHLLVIDILAVGVAMRSEPDKFAAPAEVAGLAEVIGEMRPKRAAPRTAESDSGASPLSRLTSHSR